jgi:sec-independent protein translocase protein TatB
VFNIGPLEFAVLAAVALIVFGPDKLPHLAKDAGRMLRTLRDLAQGARTQITSELGPDFADFDLASLNPRTAIQRALMGEDDPPRTDPVRPNYSSEVSFTKNSKPASTPLAEGERAPYDADAT